MSGSPLLQRPENAFKTMEEYSDQTPADVARYPMVPIRDVVIFPFTKVAFKIGRPGSVRALEKHSLRTAQFSWRLSTTPLSTSHHRTRFMESAPLATSFSLRSKRTVKSKSLSKAEKEPQPFAWRTPMALLLALVRRAPVVNEEGIRHRCSGSEDRTTGRTTFATCSRRANGCAADCDAQSGSITFGRCARLPTPNLCRG